MALRELVTASTKFPRRRHCRMSSRSASSLKGECRYWALNQNGNGVFTLPDTETDTDTDKKWVVKSCVEVFTLHLHNHAIEYC